MCEPCRVARRDREREQYAARRTAGLCGRCGTPAPSDAAYCDRCARSAAKRSRKRAKNARSRQRYARRRARRLCSDCGAPSHGASRCPPCARRSWARSGEHRGLPVLPPRVTVNEIATGVESRDMGPVGRCGDVPGLRQAFPGTGGTDPGYVEHRPVSGAGVRKLVAARCARFREFAPLRLARLTLARTVQTAIFGKCVATFRVLPEDSIYVCPATWTRHDPPRLAARHTESEDRSAGVIQGMTGGSHFLRRPRHPALHPWRPTCSIRSQPHPTKTISTQWRDAGPIPAGFCRKHGPAHARLPAT